MAKVYNFKTQLIIRKKEYGESIEDKLKRMTENNEPIKETVTPIYTERKDGVIPAYDIRTDRFEVALEAMDKVHTANTAKRDQAAKEQEQKPEVEPKNE